MEPGRSSVQRLVSKSMYSRYILLAIALLLSVPAVSAQPLNLILPTSNDGLLQGDFEGFYQYTDRIFQGVRSRPWQGGQYGYVRNQKETSAGIVHTRFHEGVDIKPVYRNRNGEPRDTVRAVDGGTVVYVNDNARGSSYGKYVVVEHIWSGMPFYSLYAHLGSTRVKTGKKVRQGEMLGYLGYTGRGIDRRRAHVHFEINLLLNGSFERWHDVYFRGRNGHGIYNGVNMAGLDVAALYLELQHDPTLTIERFLRRQEPYYTVRIPNEGALDIHFRYPWLSVSGYDAAAPSIDISFSQSGLPLRIEPAFDTVADPTVVWTEPANTDYGYLTSGMLTGSYTPALANSGKRYVHLLTTGSRAPADGIQLAGRTLPPKMSTVPPAPAVARPAAQITTAPPGARSRTGSDPGVSTETVPTTIIDAESTGGEVRGW